MPKHSTAFPAAECTRPILCSPNFRRLCAGATIGATVIYYLYYIARVGLPLKINLFIQAVESTVKWYILGLIFWCSSALSAYNFALVSIPHHTEIFFQHFPLMQGVISYRLDSKGLRPTPPLPPNIILNGNTYISKLSSFSSKTAYLVFIILLWLEPLYCDSLPVILWIKPKFKISQLHLRTIHDKQFL